ncbi:colicin-like pore-forming protein [Pseudomonas sp. PB3P13]
MSGAGSYLGPHIKTGPNSYELMPVPVRAFRLPSFNGSNGLYINTGINDEHRRGSSLGGGKLSPLTPYIWDDFMGEHRLYQAEIDSEYAAVFNDVVGAVTTEIEQKKQSAKAGQELTQVDAAKSDRNVTIDTIAGKEREYQSKVESAHSLYGHNPFFLMKELPFRKVVDGVNSVPPDVVGAYESINQAYRSALELKRLSLENTILADQLAGLASKISQAEAESQLGPGALESWLADRLYAVNTEKNIRIQLLPHFLQENIVSSTGSVEGLTHSQSLAKYKSAIDSIIASEQSQIGQYVTANPNMQLPFSKPELEALRNLTHLQANTDLGKRWDDYHVSLLHSENVRHLTAAATAFAELFARAQQAEGLLEQSRLAAVAEAQRVADEQARVAAEVEAQRVAGEQARIAAEAEGLRLAAEAQAKEASYKDAVSFLADTNKHILEKYGANLAKTAKDLQNNISGKKIGSYSDAMATFEKVSTNPRLKLNAKDIRAVVDALSALDKASFADNVNRLGKAFGVVGKIVQAEAIRQKTIIGIETGEWKPLGLEVESLAVGTLAAFAAGALFASLFALTTTLTVISVPVVAVIMALSASYFDVDKVEEINNYFLNRFGGDNTV